MPIVSGGNARCSQIGELRIEELGLRGRGRLFKGIPGIVLAQSQADIAVLG